MHVATLHTKQGIGNTNAGEH